MSFDHTTKHLKLFSRIGLEVSKHFESDNHSFPPQCLCIFALSLGPALLQSCTLFPSPKGISAWQSQAASALPDKALSRRIQVDYDHLYSTVGSSRWTNRNDCLSCRRLTVTESSRFPSVSANLVCYLTCFSAVTADQWVSDSFKHI